MKLTDEELKAIREAVEAATPGPWEQVANSVFKSDNFKINLERPKAAAPEAWEEIKSRLFADAHLIANAPTWLISLLDHINELEEKLTDRETRLRAGEQSYINSQAKCEILQRGLDDANKKLARLEERQNVNS